MPARSSWKGYLNLSLVSVPVKAFTATSTGSKINLNQLHENCHSRIKYQKVCPVHGEVSGSEIVSGYEYAKGQYVVVDVDELEQLRTEGDKSIAVDCFVGAGEVDAAHHSGKTYYLVPDGPVGQKPYSLLQQSMREQNLHAVARVVLSKKEQLVLLRPAGKLIAMSVLSYHGEVKQPASFEDELVPIEATAEERELTKTLIGALVKEEFDLAAYPDVYTERLTALIESKVEGKELVSPPAEEATQVINLMDALKASVQQIQVPKKDAPQKPGRRMAESKTTASRKKTKAATKTSVKQKRKSG